MASTTSTPVPAVRHSSVLLCRAAAYLAFLLVSAPFLYHLAHHSNAYLGLLDGGYFYYATIADHLVTQGRLTFDGETLTNGFQPLWLVTVTGLRMVCGGFGPAFYVALTALSFAAMVATYELGARLAHLLGASVERAAVLAAVYATATARLLSGGTETTLAVPLLLWLLVEFARPPALTPARAAKLGFVASLAILARVDSAIAVALCIAGFMWFERSSVSKPSRLFAAFSTAGLLVPVYVAANLWVFRIPLPVSTLARRLYTAGVSLAYARSVAFTTVYGPTIAVVLPLGIAAVLVLRHPRRDAVPPRALLAASVSIGFALLFFFLHALPGWIFFDGDAYPIATASLSALALATEPGLGWLPGTPVTVAAAACLIALQPLLATRYYVEHGPWWSITDNTMLAASYDISRYMKTREGLYAMGANAGTVSYLSGAPLLQLEGIVSDKHLLNRIRREDPLDVALRENGVDYLVVSLGGTRPERRNGCYQVTQPSAEWAGTRALKMRGEICDEPIAHFVTPAARNSWAVFPSMETFIWDVDHARWRSPGYVTGK
jgi:hypothetical protein